MWLWKIERTDVCITLSTLLCSAWLCTLYDLTNLSLNQKCKFQKPKLYGKRQKGELMLIEFQLSTWIDPYWWKLTQNALIQCVKCNWLKLSLWPASISEMNFIRIISINTPQFFISLIQKTNLNEHTAKNRKWFHPSFLFLSFFFLPTALLKSPKNSGKRFKIPHGDSPSIAWKNLSYMIFV